jgi:hypoxanthine phosphoribosyltransferase
MKKSTLRPERSRGTIVVNNDRFVPFLTERKIKSRVKQLAKQISRDYKGRVPIFIGVLNGSFIFFADLIREITIDCEVDFLKLSSYGDAKISSGQVKILKELNCQVTGNDIIVVEDIIDSGRSIDFMKKLVLEQNPKSFAVAALLLKKDVARLDFPIDYVGFEIPSDFVIGYGLDYAQKVRNLKSIYRLANQQHEK